MTALETSDGVIAKIRDHLADGQECEFRPWTPRQAIPPFDDEAEWGPHTVLADDLVEVLLSDHGPRHRLGARLSGLRIVGDLDLRFARLEHQVSLNWCQLGDRAIDLSDAQARTIDLHGSACGCIVTQRCRVEGALVCSSMVITSPSAAVDPEARAIDAEGASISHNLILSGSVVRGAIWLVRTKIGAQLLFQRGSMTNPGGTALDAGAARIASASIERIAIEGSVRLPGTEISGQLSLSGSAINCPDDIALAIFGVDVAGEVFLDEEFLAIGRVLASGAHLRSELICRTGRFLNPGGEALTLDGADVTGDVDLSDGFTAEGTVSLVGARIGGRLSGRGGRFTAPGNVALLADRAEIAGGMALVDGFLAEGEVRLLGARIGGQLACSGGSFSNRQGDALAVEDAEIVGGVSSTGSVPRVG